MSEDRSDLSKIREQIDALDAKIQQLISDRARLAFQVGRSKGDLPTAVGYYRPEREAQVLRAVRERNEGPLSDSEILRLFREIMSACLARQEPMRVAYLGPEGTFTQQAVHQHFGHSVLALSQPGIQGVFEQVQAGEADFGVVPIENSTQGVVTHTLDLFVDSSLQICGEVEIPIHHNLLTHAGSLNGIERVYAHQQSLSQCRQWLQHQLPHAQALPVSSNAEAARRVRNAPEAAAIASLAAAEIYAVPVLFTNIEDEQDNTTRFLVIGREGFSPSGDDKSTLLLTGDESPGLLHALLSPLARHGVNMSRIESRPAPHRKWQYVFFIDVDGHAHQEPLKTALEEMEKVGGKAKLLGSYPCAVQPRVARVMEDR